MSMSKLWRPISDLTDRYAKRTREEEMRQMQSEAGR